jgi:hypothetical protein
MAPQKLITFTLLVEMDYEVFAMIFTGFVGGNNKKYCWSRK